MRLPTKLLAGVAALAAVGLTGAAHAEGTYSWGTSQTTYYYGPSTTSGYETSLSYRSYYGGSAYLYQSPYTAYSGTSTGGVDMRGQGSGMNIGKYSSHQYNYYSGYAPGPADADLRGQGSGRNYGATTGYMYEQRMDPSVED
jgi:hypothetical protein